MRNFSQLLLAGVLMLGGCSDAAPENSAEEMVMVESDSAPVNRFGFHEAMQPGIDPFGESATSAKDLAQDAKFRIAENADVTDKQENGPSAQIEQIAYAYDYGFSITQENIPALQKEHVVLCEKMGPKCRMLRLSQAGTDGFDGYGELRLQVDATQARAFGRSLQEPAEKLGGKQVSFVVDGEDLSETIIDTEAKLQSRMVLRDKLTAILRGNRGSVDELVKAERAVAEVNEEIDANRSKLEEMHNRIRFSAISIRYDPYLGQTAGGFSQPVWTALTSIGSTLGRTIAILVYLATALVPITLFVLGLRWLWRKSGLRIRRRKTADE